MAKRRMKPRDRDRAKWRIGDWQREALKLWKIRVKERADYKCERCSEIYREDGKVLQVQAHHLIDCRVMLYAFDPLNGICLCARCHKINKHMSVHANPVAFMDWLSGYDDGKEIDRWDWWEFRYRTTAETTPPTLKEYPEIVARLTGETK